jgi:hypothetical protein
LNGTHQFFVYAGDVDMLVKNTITIKDSEVLLEASKEVGLEVNTEKTNYMFMSCHQSAGQVHNLLM